MPWDLASFRMIEKATTALDFFRTKAVWRNFLRSQAGVSALEFSLLAPIILLGSLSVADIAFLAYQRMAIDQILRIGAQQAMLDKSTSPTAEDIVMTLKIMATSNKFVANASRYCVCQNAIDSPHVACSTICTGSKPTLAFYSIRATSMSSNMLLPNVSLTSEIRVQVR